MQDDDPFIIVKKVIPTPHGEVPAPHGKVLHLILNDDNFDTNPPPYRPTHNINASEIFKRDRGTTLQNLQSSSASIW